MLVAVFITTASAEVVVYKTVPLLDQYPPLAALGTHAVPFHAITCPVDAPSRDKSLGNSCLQKGCPVTPHGAANTSFCVSVGNVNVKSGIVVGLVTLTVNNGSVNVVKSCAEKLVTVPVFDVQVGVKYSNAVAPALTLNNWLAVPNVPNPVPPLVYDNNPLHATSISTACKSAVVFEPVRFNNILVSLVLVSAEGVTVGIVGNVCNVLSPAKYCPAVPPKSNSCECVVPVAAFTDAKVIVEGVPKIIVPDVVKLVKSIPAPLFTAVTVPDVKVGNVIKLPSPATY